MMTDLSRLEPGQPVFVEIYGAVHVGTVSRHWQSEQMVQVQTKAAKVIMHAWNHMSFRWSDGKADALRKYASIHVPDTMEEQGLWEAKAKRTAAGFGQLGLDLFSAPADPLPALSAAT